MSAGIGDSKRNTLPRHLSKKCCFLNSDSSEINRDSKLHGGDEPDHADFVMYSILKPKMRTRSMVKFFNAKMDESVQAWYSNMDYLCKSKNENKVMHIN